MLGQFRYEEVRRVTGANAVVEEHLVRSTTPKGVKVEIPACVVIRVDDQGRITSIDEYADVSSLAAL